MQLRVESGELKAYTRRHSLSICDKTPAGATLTLFCKEGGMSEHSERVTGVLCGGMGGCQGVMDAFPPTRI